MSAHADPRLVLAVLERAAEMVDSGRSCLGAIDAAARWLSLDPDGPLGAAVWHDAIHTEYPLRAPGQRTLTAESCRAAAGVLRSHTLSVCLFVGAIAGALPIEARRLITAHCATRPEEHDPHALLGLADLVEERGLVDYAPPRPEDTKTPPPLAQWAEERQGWLEATGHEHVWLPWWRGGEERCRGVTLMQGETVRCTCGLFEHEANRRPRKTLTAAARRRLEEIRDRAVSEFRGHRADMMIVDDPHGPDPLTVHDE